MAGPATLSAAGSWTSLATNLAKLQDSVLGGQQAAFLGVMNAGVLPPDLATVPDEINQFIELAQVGFGAQIPGAVTGTRLDYWTTAALILQWLKIHVNRGAPRSGDRK